MSNKQIKEGEEVEGQKAQRLYTKGEVAKHATLYDCWLIIRGKVYDVTPFAEEHPGGFVILEGAGKDASDMFDDVGHSGAALHYLEEFYIGDLAPDN